MEDEAHPNLCAQLAVLAKGSLHVLLLAGYLVLQSSLLACPAISTAPQ